MLGTMGRKAYFIVKGQGRLLWKVAILAEIMSSEELGQECSSRRNKSKGLKAGINLMIGVQRQLGGSPRWLEHREEGGE